MRKAERDLIRLLAERGIDRPERTRNGHWKIVTPGGTPIYHGTTSSDHRALKNLLSTVERVLRQEEAEARAKPLVVPSRPT